MHADLAVRTFTKCNTFLYGSGLEAQVGLKEQSSWATVISETSRVDKMSVINTRRLNRPLSTLIRETGAGTTDEIIGY